MAAPRSGTANFVLLAPQAVSVSPASGRGLQQTFTFHYSDGAGATDLSTMFVWFNASFSNAAGSCFIEYSRPATLYLLNDAGNAWSSAAVGSGGTLANSHRSINAGSSNAPGSCYVDY